MKILASETGVVIEHDVFLNGTIVSDVVVADDEAGFVAVRSRDEHGNFIPQGAGGFKVDIRNGRVEIVRKTQAIQ